MRARNVALSVLLLAAIAALAAQRSGDPAPAARLAGLLAGPAPTVTRAARADLASSVPVRALAQPAAGAPPGGAQATPFVVTSAAGRPLVPGQPRQLTQDGCCYSAWWATDSQSLYVLDQPAGAVQTTIYRLPMWPPGQAAEPADLGAMGGGPGDGRYEVQPADDATTVRDRQTGATWRLPTDGKPVRVSPDGSRVVWWSGHSGRQSDTEVVPIWSSRIDGSSQTELGGLWDADVITFLPDNRRVLVTGRPANDRATAILATLDVDTAELKSVAKGLWLDRALPAPDGRWVAYTTSLDQEDPSANGVWLAAVDGGPPRKLPFEGAYRWRDGDRLVFMPLEPGAPVHKVLEYDARTQQSRQLLDPATVPIRVANNDWSVSPDGQTLAWVAEEDRNLWVVDLPE
jgi:Tol biopolymer transport system component